MNRLYLILFLLVTLAMLAAAVLQPLLQQTERVQQVKETRTANRKAIHRQVAESHGGRVWETELESRCGRAVYSLEVEDEQGRRQWLYYDIDSAEPLTREQAVECRP